jgi:hypothetical protein
MLLNKQKDISSLFKPGKDFAKVRIERNGRRKNEERKVSGN